MELSRRDALAALAAAGVAAGGAASFDHFPDHGGFGDTELATLTAVAEVVYPTEVDEVGEFVGTFVTARASARPGYEEPIVEALADLDAAATDWYGAPFRELDAETRDSVLREVGCETADPDPAGTTAERLRFYLVNELLFALYTSPAGGRLVGLENPQGHPGGTSSYQRGPR